MTSKSFSGAAPLDVADMIERSFGPETNKVRTDVDAAFEILEAKTGFPMIDWLDLAAAAGVTANGSVDIIARGRDLLNGGAYASVTIAGLTLDAVVPGVGANAFSAEIIDSLGGGLTLDMTTDPNALVIDQGGSASNEDTIATAINNAAADTFGKIRANSAGGGAMAIAAEVPLVGGVGVDFSADINGVAVPLLHPVGAATAAASMSDTTITLNPPALTGGGAAAGDACNLHLLCNAVMVVLSSNLV